MRYLLLLSAVGITFAFFPFFPNCQPDFPFLRGVSWAGLQEFNRIQNDRSLTHQQYDSEMDKWAAKYGVSDAYNNYKQKLEDQKKTAEKELDDALKALPKFFEEIRKIENDPGLTWDQAAEKKRQLYSTLTPKQTQIAKDLTRLFAPPYANCQQPPQPVPYGPPGPYWPVVCGPVPCGPYMPFRG
ncbi:hypothetical protein ANCCAN_23012 [Ancylostoma caninum]|uniref:SXP/RAL-2 family protein Ani s 5-like cation-binding domain-containing protein n=1 Tax=Ancylostoma caninum TaxID=29170 RepID=A0A368FG52_ANCCA|nr:hypothetical protein ANCCAN_23012 [Ancylostoma caninum]